MYNTHAKSILQYQSKVTFLQFFHRPFIKSWNILTGAKREIRIEIAFFDDYWLFQAKA